MQKNTATIQFDKNTGQKQSDKSVSLTNVLLD